MCMKRRSFLRSSAAPVGVVALGSGDSHADDVHPHRVPGDESADGEWNPDARRMDVLKL